MSLAFCIKLKCQPKQVNKCFRYTIIETFLLSGWQIETIKASLLPLILQGDYGRHRVDCPLCALGNKMYIKVHFIPSSEV